MKNGTIEVVKSAPAQYPTGPNSLLVFEGFVKVKFIVNSAGKVTQALVIESEPKRKFNKSALRSIKQSIYSKRNIWEIYGERNIWDRHNIRNIWEYMGQA